MAIKRKRKRILDQLKALRIFDQSPTVRQLRNELKQKLEKIQHQDEVKARKKRERERKKRAVESRVNRSRAQKRYHNYIHLIYRNYRHNYSTISYADVRKMYKLRKKGREVEIPDVIWQNPSP